MFYVRVNHMTLISDIFLVVVVKSSIKSYKLNLHSFSKFITWMIRCCKAQKHNVIIRICERGKHINVQVFSPPLLRTLHIIM